MATILNQKEVVAPDKSKISSTSPLNNYVNATPSIAKTTTPVATTTNNVSYSSLLPAVNKFADTFSKTATSYLWDQGYNKGNGNSASLIKPSGASTNVDALYSAQNKAPMDMAPYATEDAYNTAKLVNDLKAQIASNSNPTVEEVGDTTSGDAGATSYQQALQDAYNQRANLIMQNYNSALEGLLSGYNFNADAVNQSADNALREAYINRMLSQKNLAQQLSMNGLNGGAAESTIAGLLNNYGNSRNNIETERINSLAELLAAYQESRQKAQQSYNEALLSAMPSYAQLLK